MESRRLLIAPSWPHVNLEPLKAKNWWCIYRSSACGISAANISALANEEKSSCSLTFQVALISTEDSLNTVTNARCEIPTVAA